VGGLVRAAVIAGLASALCAASLAGTADAAKKRRTVRVPYTVTIDFAGSHEMVGVLGSTEVLRSDEAAAWTGTSTPFAIVRTGTGAKARFRIAPYLGTLPQIALTGPAAVTGRGFTVTGGGCMPSWTIAGGDDAAARTVLSLLSNRMRLRMAFTGTAFQKWSWNECYPLSGDTPCESWCVAIPPEDAAGAAFWAKFGAIDRKALRFGKAFTLTRIRDPITDPTLSVDTPGGEGTAVHQQWIYRWVLTFTPVRR
jgi:hypothetical protein